MNAPPDCLVSTKVLFSDYTFSFLRSFIPFITDNCNYGSFFREGIQIKIFSLLRIIYPKININVVKTISPHVVKTISPRQ